jgi:hypothetical protein
MENSELLGPAEMHIVQELRQTINGCLKNAEELVEALEKLDINSNIIEKMMLDPKGKETIIATLDPFDRLKDNLGGAALMPTILAIVLKIGDKA